MRHPWGARRRAAAVGAVALSAGLLLGVLGPPATGAPTSLPGLCPAAAAPLTPVQAGALLTLAGRRYGPAADVDRRQYPFGAVGDATVWVRKGSAQWTSGFFPASLWLLYESHPTGSWLRRARQWTDSSLPLATWSSPRGHDLGFMVGLPTGLAARLDPSASRRAVYRAAQLTAARTLTRFYDRRIGALVSTVEQGRPVVIVDDVMNGTSLLAAAPLAGAAERRRLRATGLTHLRTLARLLIRADGSTYHRLAVEPATGTVTPIPGQGAAPATSTWSRGQAWAVAGFARAYVLTRDPGMLAAARRTAQFWLSRLPAGCLPAWDFDVTPPLPLDSSAAAVLAGGLLDLAATDPDATQRAQWRAAAEVTLGTLAGPEFTTSATGRPGVLWRQTYNVPVDAREGTYVWGDHYLLAAVLAARARTGGSDE